MSWDKYDLNINRYKKSAGTTKEYWEEQGWITKDDPYGWFQWYCRFYKRKVENDQPLESPDSAEHLEDLRQINRWRRFTGDADEEWGMGRWKARLLNMMKDRMEKSKMSVEQVV